MLICKTETSTHLTRWPWQESCGGRLPSPRHWKPMKEICGWRHGHTHIDANTPPYQAQAGKGSHSWRCLHDQAKAKREREYPSWFRFRTQISRKPCSAHPCNCWAIGMLGTLKCSRLLFSSWSSWVKTIFHIFQHVKPFSTQVLVSFLILWKNPCPLPFGLGFELSVGSSSTSTITHIA